MLVEALHRQEGSALIETSIALATFLLLMMGMMEFSRAMYADAYVGYAAHLATRYAMVRGSTWNGRTCATAQSASCTASASDVASFVKSIAPVGIDISSSLTVTPTWPGNSVTGSACVTTNGSNSPGCAVKVQVAYNFSFSTPFISGVPLRLASTSAVTIAQ